MTDAPKGGLSTTEQVTLVGIARFGTELDREIALRRGALLNHRVVIVALSFAYYLY
jgi:hypothetical protein